MKIYLLSILLFTSCLIKAQNTAGKLDEIYKKIHKIESIKTSLVKTFEIKMDSVYLNISDYTTVIEAEGYIGKSENKFKVIYFLSSNKLEAIITKEINLSNLYMEWIFNLEKGKIRNEFPCHTVSICAPEPMNENFYKANGYNESWNKKFLKKLVMKLFEEIKNYR